jgi:hypothetical protein
MGRVTEFNEAVARRATLIFGSMPTTYAFFLYGFLPVLLPGLMVTLLYWSNTVQLWSLPLLMVGNAVIARATEQRDQETHDTVMAELGELRLERGVLEEVLERLRAMDANSVSKSEPTLEA